MCYPEQEFKVGGSDVLLGEIGAVPFYMSAAQFELPMVGDSSYDLAGMLEVASTATT